MNMHYIVGGDLGFNVSGVPSGGYSESALRFGLMNVRPIEVVETIKRFGLKLRRVTRSFESLKPTRSYADLVNFENEAIFGSIEIPKWFDAEKIVQTFSNHSITNYEQDTELKEEVERLRKAKRMGRPLLSFTQFIIQRFESKRDNYLEVEAHRFLNSNLPFSFYNKLTVFDNTYYDFLKIVEDIVRMYEFRANAARSFEMYRRKIDEMKRKLIPLIDKLDECHLHYSRSKKYVSIWNSKDYEEILYPKFLDINKVDYSEFERISNDYETKLRETREILLDYNADYLREELDLKDPTTKMFGKLLMLPQSSFNLDS